MMLLFPSKNTSQMKYVSQVTSTEENLAFLTIVRNIKVADTGADLCK